MAAAAAAATCRDYPAVRTQSRVEAQVGRKEKGDEVRGGDGGVYDERRGREGRGNCMEDEEEEKKLETGQTWAGNLELKEGGRWWWF